MTTDLVLRDDGLAPEVIGTAHDLATKVAKTEFVPGALRGKPEAIMACILMGREIGVGPMQSLSKIHIVDGRPAMAAELMRARALEAGHDLWIEEKSSTRVTVAGRRKGSDKVSMVTWTMDDAKRAGIQGKNNWRKYPRQMLTARATAELCRDIFADCLGGVSYSVEELEDGGFEDETPDGEPIKAEPKKTAAKRGTVRRQAPAGQRERAGLPPLPNELDQKPADADGDDDIVDAELVDDEEDEGDGLDDLTKAQLQLRCKRADLPTSGNKDDLIARLRGEDVGQDGEGDADGGEESPADADDDAADDGFPEPPTEGHESKDPTDAQRKKLFATLREHDITDDQRKGYIRGRFKVDSLNDLSRADLAATIDDLEADPQAFARKADGYIVKRRVGDALGAMTSQHERYAEMWEWLAGLVDDPGRAPVEAWAAACGDEMDAFVAAVEELAVEAKAERR